MRTLGILTVKRFDAAKQRLSDLLGAGARQALALAMFSDVMAALRRSRRLDALCVVTADPVAESAAQSHRIQVIADSEQAGQSAAALLGIQRALAERFERVLLLPGDTPLLDPTEIDGLLERSAAGGDQLVIVPDRHGTGTNGLLIAPPDAFVPSFGPGSLERHVGAAKAAGLRFRVEALESLGHDVDTPEDLESVRALIDARRGAAPMTHGSLNQLGRLHAARAGAAPPGVGAKLEA